MKYYCLPIDSAIFSSINLPIIPYWDPGPTFLLFWSPNILGDLLSRYTKGIIFIFPWLMLWLAFPGRW